MESFKSRPTHEQRRAEEAAAREKAREKATEARAKEATERQELEQASHATWSVVQQLYTELGERKIGPDIGLLGTGSFEKYRQVADRHRSPSAIARGVRNKRERNLAQRGNIGGWNLHTQVGDDPKKMKSLYLGTDGNLYAMGWWSDAEKERGIVIPEDVYKPGDVLPSTKQCEQALDGLDNLAYRYRLTPPESWVEPPAPEAPTREMPIQPASVPAPTPVPQYTTAPSPTPPSRP